MDTAKEFAIALENASREVIGLDIAKLTKTQLELYKSRAALEQIKWVELIKKRDAVIRAEARAEELREAADRAWNFLKVNPYCYRWNEKELRAAITQEPQP
jgi:hypothetical protein